ELADAVKSDTLPVVGMKVEAYEVGAELSSEVNIEADTLLKIIKLTEKFGLRSRLTGIDMSKIYNIRLTLDSVISVELGNSEDLDRKISLVRQILDLNPIIQRSTVDVHDVEKGRYRIEN
ncbi:MAG: cell division protein FtsQ/DivIB, partial [Eubacteriales bacterium]